METLSQDSILECQICFNYYSPRRRPKLLDCRHTCCSVCLTALRSSQKEIRCPWCRGVTPLPAGLSVSALPDDPDVVAVIAIPSHAGSDMTHTPVFIRLPSNGCYMLPLPATAKGGSGVLPGDAMGTTTMGGGYRFQKGLTVAVALPEMHQQHQHQHQRPLALGMVGIGGTVRGLEMGMAGGVLGGGGGGGEGGERRGVGGPGVVGVVGGTGKGSTWSGVCTVILVACVLLFLLGIVLHNMSCISKRFTVISCG